ncbi:MAG TPA: ATP-binding cassette domain-containing protein [Streptosporangiaceae bacterium]|nr:ATP-binding cassette domain-containing protein [Streptosporangiaceae bacterium]
MIEARGLTKRYGGTLAVDDLSFSVAPGKITGFLGPNGAGKTTTMRLILGLDRPTAGRVTINGKPFDEVEQPMRQVGALLDAKAVHGGRSAYNHLLCVAQSNNLPRRRVDEVLGLVGLTSVARKRAKGFSLGMGQRLGIAAALLGDPQILMFDEPVNGLDPEGILWIRNLMKALAAEGRTIFVSSHLMSEMENTADHLLVIGRGRLIADCTVDEFIAANSQLNVRVRTPQPDQLAKLVAAAGATVRENGDGSMVVSGLDPARVGDLAYENAVRLHELAPVHASLEQAFMELTASSVEFHAGVPEAEQPALAGKVA